jgi:hypothetical protein
MAGDMVVALGRATADGSTLFGHNCTSGGANPLRLVRNPGRTHAAGEVVRTTFLDVPQPRQTCAVLGARPEGAWGYAHGVNEHGVAAGCTRLRTRVCLDGPGLTGMDLVRLGLERGRTAHQAVDALTSLIARHGQGAFGGSLGEGSADAAFVVADAREAFVLEAAGRFWVRQEVREVRAVGDVCTVRQDWDAIAPGLASHAIGLGRWPEDGTKLDFAGALGGDPDGDAMALRRWGRATLRLEEQNGHIDAAYLRRLLGDHDADPGETEDSSLCRHSGRSRPTATAASLVAHLGGSAGPAPLAWWAFGPPCESVCFPIVLAGELPPAFSGTGEDDLAGRMARLLGSRRTRPARLRAALEGLQALFENEAAEFCVRAAAAGDPVEVSRLAGRLMQQAWDEFVEVCDGHARPVKPDQGLALSSAGVDWVDGA